MRKLLKALDVGYLDWVEPTGMYPHVYTTMFDEDLLSILSEDNNWTVPFVAVSSFIIDRVAVKVFNFT